MQILSMGMILAVLTAGCGVIPSATVKCYLPDPLRKEVVEVTACDGSKVKLADGREMDLSWLDTGALSAHMRRYLQKQLSHEIVGKKFYPKVHTNGTVTLLQVNMRDEPKYESECLIAFSQLRFGDNFTHDSGGMGCPSAMALFPVIRNQEHERRDINLMMLERGLSNTRSPSAPESYTSAVGKARSRRRGIWIGDGLLAVYAEMGAWDTVKQMLSEGCPVDAVDNEYRTALTNVVSCLRFDNEKEISQTREMIRLLLDKGADINGGGTEEEGWSFTPLHAAVGNTELLRLLLAHGANVNITDSYGQTALNRAIDMNGDSVLEVASLLIKAGADVGTTDRWASTPLHHAATEGNTAIINLLLSHGADIEAPNEFGKTPLMDTVLFTEKEAALCLIKAGADINRVTRSGGRFEYRKTVLSLAVDKRKHEMAEFLLQNGANPDIPEGGHEPIFRAIFRNDIEMVKVLIRYGADMVSPKYKGRSPLEYAKRLRPGSEIVKLLKEQKK